MTSTLGIKKIQYPNGTDILTLDSSGSLAIGSDLTVDTNTLHVDASNNRVGVGSTAPLKALHVQGASEADIFLRREDLTNKSWKCQRWATQQQSI